MGLATRHTGKTGCSSGCIFPSQYRCTLRDVPLKLESGGIVPKVDYDRITWTCICVVKLIEPSTAVTVSVHVPATGLLGAFAVTTNETAGPVTDTVDGPVRNGLFVHELTHP